jgi:hypothetical protein
MGIIENEVVVDFLYKVRHQGKAIWGGGVLNWRLMLWQTRTSECALLPIDRDKPRGTFVWLVKFMVGGVYSLLKSASCWIYSKVDTQHWWYGVGIGLQILSVCFGRRLSPNPEAYNEWIHQSILKSKLFGLQINRLSIAGTLIFQAGPFSGEYYGLVDGVLIACSPLYLLTWSGYCCCR